MSNINEEFQMAMEQHENELNQEERKEHGIFYTDVSLAQMILEDMKISKSSSLLDPCCGMGVFLKIAQQMGIRTVYGIDNDTFAIDYLRANCKSIKAFVADSIFGNRYEVLKKLGREELFDYIVGNPPYVPLKSNADMSKDKVFNAYVRANGRNLFVAALISALNLLKKDGVLAYIIPKNFLHVQGYSKFRKDILKTKTILEVVDLGMRFKDVRGEQIVIFIKNQEPSQNSKITFKQITDKGFETLVEVPQSLYSDEIIILNEEMDILMYNKLLCDYPRLGDNLSIDVARGRSKENNAVCGKEIRKFGLKERNVPDSGNQIFIQNIYSAESGIIAAFGGNEEASETITVLRDTDKEYCNFLLGVLHSRLCNIFLYKFCYNSSVVTMHTDAIYLRRIPLPTENYQKLYVKKIVALVEELQSLEYMSDKWMLAHEKLNEQIYRAYNLSAQEVEFFSENAKKIQSDKWFRKSKIDLHPEKRCNDLDGKQWLQNSFSIWRDLKKSTDEKNFQHPASYPVALCQKVIETFTKSGAQVLDPFNGIGSTTVAAVNLGRKAVGIDLSEEFCNIARNRITDSNEVEVICGDSFEEVKKLQDNSFDLCLTSPPYWDILNMRRTVDVKANINYSDNTEDVGNISDYSKFVAKLGDLFAEVQRKLKPRGYCIINVMDIRKKSNFYPLHIDLVNELQKRGLYLDDIIIWDRQSDYNNMKTLGYPYRFRINKVHEYLLIFTKGE